MGIIKKILLFESKLLVKSIIQMYLDLKKLGKMSGMTSFFEKWPLSWAKAKIQNFKKMSF